MNKFLFLLGLCFMFIACEKAGNKDNQATNETADKTAAVESKPLPRFFYKKLAGKIGDNMFISMDLTRNDTALEGIYIYLSKKQPIQLSGTIDAEGNVRLAEFVTVRTKDGEDLKETGKFTGKMDNSSFKGTWSGGGKSFPFELTESKDKNYAQLSYESHIKSYKAQGNEGDGGATIDYAYCQVTDCGNEAAKTAINQSIMREILMGTDIEGKQKMYASIEEKMADYIADFRKDATELNTDNAEGMSLNYDDILSTQILYNYNHLLSISYFVSTYMGGAHPNSGVSYKNYDLHSGKILTLNDVLIPNYKSKLLPIAEKLFREQNGVGNQSLADAGYFDMDEDKGKFSLAENVAFQADGLLFTYGQYEIAAYAMGMPGIKVPYTAIKDLIKKDGALAWAL